MNRFMLIASLLISLAVSSFTFARPNHVVFGYAPSWRDATAAPEDFNFDAFTHLSRAFLRPKVDGTLSIESNYFDAAFEKAARAHGVKLLMSIGGEAKTPDVWLAMARDPEHVETFLNTLAGLFAEHQYDGVDIDWEPPPQTEADGRTYASLLQSIRRRFPDKLLTIAISGTNYGLGHLPMKEVIASIDYLNAMTYDYAGPWTGIATYGENLRRDPTGIARTRTSVEEGLKNLIEGHGVPPDKILLGMSFWPYRFHVDHLGDMFPAHAKGYADNIEYGNMLDLLGTGKYTAHRDDVVDAAYLTRNDGGSVITYDDEKSVRDKCGLAMAAKCAGVMIWHAGADLVGGQTPLLSAISESLGNGKLPISRPALEHEITRLTHQPVAAGRNLDDLKQLDDQLRADHAKAEDAHWTASAPPATQPKAVR